MTELLKIPDGVKITGYKVLTDEPVPEPVKEEFKPDQMHEGVKRPHKLLGSTYKIKPVGHDSALYMTINDIVMNEGTEYEHLHPYEIFLNSSRMESYQWIVTVTRLLSAIFRKGGNITFITDELEAIFNPEGGYFGRDHTKGKGKYYGSVVAELGHVIRGHMTDIGMLKPVYNIVEEQAIEKTAPMSATELDTKEDTEELDPGTFRMDKKCTECNSDVFRMADNCPVCIACGDSKCS